MKTSFHRSLSLLIDTYVKNEAEKDSLFNAVENFLVLKRRQTGIKWINDKRSSFASRLIAFACVEGIFFSERFVPFLAKTRKDAGTHLFK